MNWCSVLGHEHSFFNAIVSRKSPKEIEKPQNKGLCLQKAHQDSAQNSMLQKQSLCKHFFPYKTQSFSKKTDIS